MRPLWCKTVLVYPTGQLVQVGVEGQELDGRVPAGQVRSVKWLKCERVRVGGGRREEGRGREREIGEMAYGTFSLGTCGKGQTSAPPGGHS